MADIQLADIPILHTWSTYRERTIQSLFRLADETDRQNRKVKATGAVGSAASAIGSTVAVGSVIFTGGLSLVGIVAATSIGGAVTSIGGKYFESKLQKDAMENTNKVIESERAQLRQVEGLISRLRTAEEDSLALMLLEIESGSDSCEDEVHTGSDTWDTYFGSEKRREENVKNAKAAAHIVGSAMIVKHGIDVAKAAPKGWNIANFVKSAADFTHRNVGGIFSSGRVGSTGLFTNVSRMAKFGAAFNAILLPLDIAECVQNTRALKEGAVHEASKEIREAARRLEEEKNDITRKIVDAVSDISRLSTALKRTRATRYGFQSDLLRGMERIVADVLLPLGLSVTRSRPYYAGSNPMGTLPSEPKANAVLVMNSSTDNESTFKEVAKWLSCASRMGKQSLAVLLGTNFTQTPALWKPFGRTMVSTKGVSVIVLNGFDGVVCGSSQQTVEAHAIKFIAKDEEVNLITIISRNNRERHPRASPSIGIMDTFFQSHATGNYIIVSNSKQLTDDIITSCAKDTGMSYVNDDAYIFMSYSFAKLAGQCSYETNAIASARVTIIPM